MTEKALTTSKEWLEERGIPFSPESANLDEATIVALSVLMTNTNRPVMAFTGMPAEEIAAVFARYSRSPLPLRLVYINEFLGKKDNLRGFFDRVLSGYGDDSVSQLGTVSFACEMVSQLAVKGIEDGRIGVACLEKSTRYVDFGKKVNGSYLYFRPPEVMGTDIGAEYIRVMDEAFETYGLTYRVMLEHVRQKFPWDGQTDMEVYKASTRAKALDVVRVFLPMATLTNVGAVMSAQAAEGMINKMMISPVKELQVLAHEIYSEVSQVVPSLVGRVQEDKYGGKTREYLDLSRLKTAKKAKEILGQETRDNPETPMGVSLVWSSEHNLEKVVAAILFTEAEGASLAELEVLAEGMDELDKAELISAYLSGRTNRRHKPGRAFEEAVFGYEYVGKVGEWRDLQRHRMLTQERQLFTTRLGFVTPDEFNEVNVGGERLTDIYVRHMEARKRLFDLIRENISPEAAQYVVGFGHKHRWRMTMNLREMYHLIPLRASAAGHPDYRRIAREMFYLAAERDPILLAPMTEWIDFSDEPRLERLQQLANIRKKQLELGVADADTFGGEK